MALIFDRAHFHHMTAGDVDLQGEVLALFRDQVGAWRQALGEASAWRDAVHTMKGSARGIGFSALAEACESAEQGGSLDGVRAALAEALAAIEK